MCYRRFCFKSPSLPVFFLMLLICRKLFLKKNCHFSGFWSDNMSQCTEKWSVMWILVGLKFKMADCTSVPHPIGQESLPIRLDWTYTVRLLLLLMLLLVDLKSKLLFFSKILLERNWELVIENTLLKSIRLKMKKIEIKTTCIIIFFQSKANRNISIVL